VQAPRVSIILTTLNASRFFSEAIESILTQTVTDIEVIVADGGSEDGTLELVDEYRNRDSRVRLVHQAENIGFLAGAINAGLEPARGRYLSWAQADCFYAPEAFERMLAILEDHPDIGQVYADYHTVDERGAQLLRSKLCEPEDILAAPSDPLGICFLLRREVRESVGVHDHATFPCQDFDYRIRIARKFRSDYLREPLCSWRIQPDSLSSRLGWATLSRKDIEIRLRHGLLDSATARRALAEVDAAVAFEHYRAGSWFEVPPAVWSAFRGNRQLAGNRGLWSILARSLGARLLRRP
jgi:glycosyltransferase involved in cell wall biosynthesis